MDPNKICVTSTGDLFHLQKLSETLSKAFSDKKYSDVIFTLSSGQKIKAHKAILSARSGKFEELFKQHADEIILKNANETAFKIFLKYIYTGRMSLEDLEIDTILSILGLSSEYSIAPLQIHLVDKLKSVLSVNNVIEIINVANFYRVKNLISSCEQYFDQHAREIFDHESFLNISEISLIGVVKRDSLFADELIIFDAVNRWSKSDKEKAREVVKHVRLSLIDPRDITRIVRPTNIVDSDALLNILDEVLSGINRDKPRQKILFEVNLATTEMGAKVIAGENKEFLLNNEESGCTYHNISRLGDGDESHLSGITVALKEVMVINNIRMLLDDSNKNFDYKYYIEVSQDKCNWFRIIDYKNYRCRSWQNLFFIEHKAKYINIVGTCSWSSNSQFRLAAFEVYYREKIPRISYPESIVYPSCNVAITDRNAITWKKKHAVCLDGNCDSNGFASTKINEGEITIQFAQPYMVSDLRFLLYGRDGRSYSYYIEIEDENENFKLLVDKRNQKCKSWQRVSFQECPVFVIRFRGTYSSASDSLEIVHIECPSGVEEHDIKDVEEKVGSDESSSIQSSLYEELSQSLKKAL